jgi:DNA-binding beta-propeller fold protein YncE
MNARAKKIIGRTAAGVGLAIMLAFVALIVFLTYTEQPSGSERIRFDGFIRLPKHGIINVLDYLTLDGDELFVTGASSGSVFKIALKPDIGNSVVSEMRGEPRVHGVAIVSQKLAFVTRSEVNTVDAFDPTSMQPIGGIGVQDDPDAILYDPTLNLVYAANGDAGVGTLIDPQSRKIVATIPLGGKPEFPALDPASGMLYQNLNDANSIVALDLARRTVVGRWSISPCLGPTGMAIDAGHRRLFSVCSKNAMLVVFDMDQHRIVSSLPIGGGADSVAYDPAMRRIYTAGLSGTMTAIQQNTADSYQVTDNIHTHFAAHTLAVNPVSHQIFVGYASLFIQPRIAVFTAR